MDVRVGLWRKLTTEELMLLNCGIGEDSWGSLGLQGYPTSPSKGNQSWLKLQYFSHLMWRTDSFEKTLMLGKIEGGKRRGQQRIRWLDGITNLMDMKVSHSVVSDSLWPQGYKVHGILQARILEWVAFPFCRRSSQPRDRIQVSGIAGRFFTNWATRERTKICRLLWARQ